MLRLWRSVLVELWLVVYSVEVCVVMYVIAKVDVVVAPVV